MLNRSISFFQTCHLQSTHMRAMRSRFACNINVTAIESERNTRPTQFVPGNLTQPEFLKMCKSRRNECRGQWRETTAKGLEENS